MSSIKILLLVTCFTWVSPCHLLGDIDLKTSALCNVLRRQDEDQLKKYLQTGTKPTPPPDFKGNEDMWGNPSEAGKGGKQKAFMAAHRFTTRPPSTSTKSMRTTPTYVSHPLLTDCDHLTFLCLRTHKTGKMCARTIYYQYQNFKNYCMMDYVNCMEGGYEVWQLVHMGDCFDVAVLDDYQLYDDTDDKYLSDAYVIRQKTHKNI